MIPNRKYLASSLSIWHITLVEHDIGILGEFCQTGQTNSSLAPDTKRRILSSEVNFFHSDKKY